MGARGLGGSHMVNITGVIVMAGRRAAGDAVDLVATEFLSSAASEPRGGLICKRTGDLAFPQQHQI